jgi:hypothetical protein
MKLPKHIALDDLFIINDADCPEAACIARKSSKNGKFYYIHPKLRAIKDYYGMTPTRPTPIKDFGVRMVIEANPEGGSTLKFTVDQASTATYRDGKPRRWQGTTSFSIPWP